MNEEEKEAVEYLKTHIIPLYKEGKIELLVNETILGLINKQQKQIEELKEKYSKKLIEFQKEREWYEKNHISKDKIKAKAQELDNQQRQWREDRTNKHTDAQIIYARDVLDELLVSGQESDQEGGQEDE